MGGQQTVADFVSVLKGKHVKIVTIMEEPFVMFKQKDFDWRNKTLSTDTDVEGM